MAQTRILSACIKWIPDEITDVSFLNMTAADHYGENGCNWSHVTPERQAEIVTQYGSILGACEAYAREDQKRLAAFNRGDWHMLGIVAECDVTDGSVVQTFRSGGLWGIESDGPDDYRNEVGQEELSVLKTQLQVYSVDPDSFDWSTVTTERR